MTQELEPYSDEIVVPLTGELVSLSDTRQVIDVLEQVRDMKRRLDEVRAVLEEAVRLESERQGSKTLHVDGMKAVVSGGSKIEYDAEALADELRDLGLPEDRVSALVVPTITYKVDGRVARSVATSNPRYAEAIERHRSVVPHYWRVTVTKG